MLWTISHVQSDFPLLPSHRLRHRGRVCGAFDPGGDAAMGVHRRRDRPRGVRRGWVRMDAGGDFPGAVAPSPLNEASNANGNNLFLLKVLKFLYFYTIIKRFIKLI